MTTWTLKTQHKKSAIEKQHWYKDGKEIIRTEGYRWGIFYCESDTQPEIDLVNEDGYHMNSSVIVYFSEEIHPSNIFKRDPDHRIFL